jgi:hypothetical protein
MLGTMIYFPAAEELARQFGAHGVPATLSFTRDAI